MAAGVFCFFRTPKAIRGDVNPAGGRLRGQAAGLMAKVTPGEYVRQVRQELRKVAWPTRKETMVTTMMVFLLTGVLAVFFLGVDWILGSGVRFLLSLGS